MSRMGIKSPARYLRPAFLNVSLFPSLESLRRAKREATAHAHALVRRAEDKEIKFDFISSSRSIVSQRLIEPLLFPKRNTLDVPRSAPAQRLTGLRSTGCFRAREMHVAARGTNVSFSADDSCDPQRAIRISAAGFFIA